VALPARGDLPLCQQIHLCHSIKLFVAAGE
jgi:hypothetical protein